MDFLESVKNVVTDAAQKVVKKSGEIVEASKVKYTIFELKGDIKKLYEEIGKQTYQTIAEDGDYAEEIKLKCDIITAKLAKIEYLKTTGVVSGVKCPSCGRAAGFDDENCPSCGADMTEEVQAEVEETEEF